MDEMLKVEELKMYFGGLKAIDDFSMSVYDKETLGIIGPNGAGKTTPVSYTHLYITNLLYAGVDPKTVQYLAGHENSKTTMDIYAKVKYNKPEELFGVVNGAFHQAIAE